ncbi:MAG: lipid A export permease/ATP-binding protein MsbA [Pseudomonadota bacterium]
MKKLANRPAETPISGRRVYLRLLSYTRQYWSWFIFSVFGFALYALTQWGWAEAMKTIVDIVEQQNFDRRLDVVGLILILFFMRGIGHFIGSYGISKVARQVVYDLRQQFFKHVLRLPMTYFRNQSNSELLTKMTFHVEQVGAASSEAVKIILQEGITVIVLMVYLLWSNWKLSLLFFIATPIIGWVIRVASLRLRRLSQGIQSSLTDVNHVVAESLRGIEVVKNYSGFEYEIHRFTKANDNNNHQTMKMAITTAISTPVVQLLIGAQLALLLGLALTPSFFGETTTGEFLAYLTAAALLTKPVRQLTQVNTFLQRGIAGASSIFEIFDTPIETTGEYRTDKIAGKIEFKNIEFHYKSRPEISAIHNVSIHIPAGSMVAFVGKTGSGKSTLLDLLLRFYDPTAGEIVLDDRSIAEYDLENLRSHMMLVNQHVVLFDRSVRDNIAFGLSNVNFEDIQAAARAACAEEFILKLPNQWDTRLGENGAQLSGGQRQRLAIARALLRKTPVVLFDEATSALDSSAEQTIQQSLQTLHGKSTMIMVAHRLATIQNADCIFVMDQGECVERGTHTELMALHGVYAELWQASRSEEKNKG